MRTRYTYHGEKRILRTKLKVEQVRFVLDNNQYCLIGTEDHREHKLFYSPIDQKYFVAIQDNRNGDLITILPPDYHNRWTIGPDAYKIAYNVIRNPSNENTEIPLSKSSFGFVEIACIFDTGFVRGIGNLEQDGANLITPETIIVNNNFRDYVLAGIKRKHLHKPAIREISVRFNGKGSATIIPFSSFAFGE